MYRCTQMLCAVLSLAAAHDGMRVNPVLGVPGFPDCLQPGLLKPNTSMFGAWQAQVEPGGQWADAHMTLRCEQRTKDFDTQLSVGCIGDSITAGVHSGNKNLTYPAQLQKMLGDGYKVTNLGACGSTMLKNSTQPYWKRGQFQALTQAKWDILIIMLGTNDANIRLTNWSDACSSTAATASNCPFSRDYGAMIDLARTLGTTSAGPRIYVTVPPPLMSVFYYGMNQVHYSDVGITVTVVLYPGSSRSW